MAEGADRPRVLVVDDDAMVLTVLLDTLAAEFVVEGASSGMAALAILERQTFDVLLADQRMPGMTGVELAERARTLQPFLVTVLLSAYTDPVDMIQAINRGQVYRFLRKPWETEELVLTLRQAHERCLLQRRNRTLLNELERRLRAVEILQQMMSAATVLAGGHPADVLLERLGEVVPHDLAGLLLAAESTGARVQLRATRRLPEANLIELYDQLLELYRCAGGEPLAAEQVRLRVDAEPEADASGLPVRSQVHLPLRIDHRVVGLLVVQAAAPDAFSADVPRLLDLLLNGTAEAIERLRLGTARQWRRLEQVLAVSPDGVVVAGAGGEVLLANQAARRLLDLPVVTGDRLWELVGVRPDLFFGDAEVAHKRQLELGGRSVVAALATVPPSSAGEAAILVLLRDVSELEQEDLRRREFVSTLSHELRSPLTSVTATLELLLSGFAGPLNAKQGEYVQIADRACQSLNQMIDNLLDLERFGRGSVELERRVMNPASPLADLVARFEAAARDRRLTVLLELDEVGEIELDPYRFEQVVNNLLGNAIKFAAAGSRVTVSLTAPAAPAGVVVLGVHNQGEAIPPAALLGLFERFRQAARRQQAGLRGSGLGLAIVRSIAQAHGGAVFAESGGGGTQLWVGLPRRGSPVREIKDSPWFYLCGGETPAVRVAAATLLARHGLRVALCPDEAAVAEVMQRAGGLCVSLDGRPLALPTICCPGAEAADLERLGEALSRVLLARGVGLTLVPEPTPELLGVLRGLGVHQVAAGHGQEVALEDAADNLLTLHAVAEALSTEARRLRPLRALLRQAGASGGERVAVIAIGHVDGYRAVYGPGRLAELWAALHAEVRRAAVTATPSLAWTAVGGGAVLAGERGELETLLGAVRARVDASIRLSLRGEDRARGFLLVGERQLPLPAVEVTYNPPTVDEARVRAALGV